MDIIEIYKMYGKTDYYDFNTGRIFRLSKMEYVKSMDVTRIPVIEDGEFIGYVQMTGDVENEIMA